MKIDKGPTFAYLQITALTAQTSDKKVLWWHPEYNLDNLDKSHSRIIEENIGLIICISSTIAKKINRTLYKSNHKARVTVGDFIGPCTLAMYKALVSNFTGTKGAFSSYYSRIAHSFCKGAIGADFEETRLIYHRAKKTKKHNINAKDYNAYGIYDIPDQVEILTDHIIKRLKTVSNIISKYGQGLTQEELMIISKQQNGETLRSIANQLELSHERIRQISVEGKNKILSSILSDSEILKFIKSNGIDLSDHQSPNQPEFVKKHCRSSKTAINKLNKKPHRAQKFADYTKTKHARELIAEVMGINECGAELKLHDGNWDYKSIKELCKSISTVVGVRLHRFKTENGETTITVVWGYKSNR